MAEQIQPMVNSDNEIFGAYAEVFGFESGDTKSKTYELPIIYNPHLNVCRIKGIERIKIISIKLYWPTKERDLLQMKRVELQREKQKLMKKQEEYINSRIVRRGRAQYEDSLLNDNNF